MQDFQGKTALVLGATSGIGRETALAFARAGAHVVTAGRRSLEGEAVADAVRRLGVKSLFIKTDVAVDADVARTVQAAVDLAGSLDAAFNNAGIEGVAVPLVDQREEDVLRLLDVNVAGVWRGLKHQLRVMTARGRGAIVNTSSVAGSVGMAGMGPYVASKHAVLGLTRSAALEAAPFGVRVNAVSPGGIETPMLDRFADDDAKRAYMKSLHPAGRIGTPAEVAAAVLWLCSDAASFVYGHDLKVDGAFTTA